MIKLKTRGNHKNQGGGKKHKTTHLGSFFTSNSNSQKKTVFQNHIAEETNQLIHEFINNGAHPDRVSIHPYFRALIDHLINFGQSLKGYYKHMGNRKHVTAEEETVDDLIGQITDFINEIHN